MGSLTSQSQVSSSEIIEHISETLSLQPPIIVVFNVCARLRRVTVRERSAGRKIKKQTLHFLCTLETELNQLTHNRTQQAHHQTGTCYKNLTPQSSGTLLSFPVFNYCSFGLGTRGEESHLQTMAHLFNYHLFLLQIIPFHTGPSSYAIKTSF